MGKGSRAPKPVGKGNEPKGPCGLCGGVGRLTKTHVPPQCAGNRGSIKRFVVMSDQHQARRSGKKIGGIHFYGLCAACNGALQSRYDTAYCELAKSLWGMAVGDGLHLPNRIQPPDIEIAPGAV